jgi:hypothetical protein
MNTPLKDDVMIRFLAFVLKIDFIQSVRRLLLLLLLYKIKSPNRAFQIQLHAVKTIVN